MGSEDASAPVVDEANIGGSKATESSPCPSKTKGNGKVPKRIHKSEREKQKREQLNELFFDLANALELTQPNNGKASILSEAAQLLKELHGQIECLKKENMSLLSESLYVTVEKNELKEENSALETQIEKLQSELDARVAQSKPNLNMPPLEFHHQQHLMPHLSGESLRLPSVDAPLQQPPAVFVVPFHPDLQGYPITNSHVSKPHARYPTTADSWPSQLLGDQLTARKEVQFSGINSDNYNNGE